MTSKDDLANLLLPSPGELADDASESLVAAILAATQDHNPSITLKDIHDVLLGVEDVSSLNALDILPLLLRYQDPTADGLIDLFGDRCSAKEIVIVVQESLEQLRAHITSDDDYAEGEESHAVQLIRLIRLYRLALPRLKLRKKSSPETIGPILEEFGETIESVLHGARQQQGRILLREAAELVSAGTSWAQAVDGATGDDLSQCYRILGTFLEACLSACSSFLDTSLLRRIFHASFPRLARGIGASVDEQEMVEVVSSVQKAIHSIDSSSPAKTSLMDVPYINLFQKAYSSPVLDQRGLQAILPILMASARANVMLNESLAIILASFSDFQKKDGHLELSPDFVMPLSVILSPLASAHPDPFIRHATFRALSLLLTLSPPLLRLEILHELVGDEQFPQMTVAAVGLAKEAIVDSLSSEASPSSILASPQMLQTLGPILLRPLPHDLFESTPRSEFLESPESKRLVECLSFYLVLLKLDRGNRTSVRDKDQIANVQKSFLSPLRTFLDRQESSEAEGSEHTHGDGLGPGALPLVALRMGLERVDEALREIGGC